jgi:SAM-dependent methyltransferase
MIESPYDAYPYPEPGRYPVDQIKNLRIDTAPRRDTWEQWFPGEKPARKSALIIGCGIYEAIAVAAQEPLLDVVGIDASVTVVDTARSIAAEAGVENVDFLHRDLTRERAGDVGVPFDFVSACGVIHHIYEAERFVGRMADFIKPGAPCAVMVYGDCFREFVPRFCEMLRCLGVQRNASGIAFVRELIAALPEHHPVRQFNSMVTDYDAQVADLWLHPYFRQYGAHELLHLFACARFKFRRWINPEVTDCSIFEKLPEKHIDVMARFMQLSYGDRCRMGQIVNHADVKLSAVFVR